MCGRDDCHSLQGFDPTLRLFSFGCFRLESRDKTFHVRNFALLFFMGGLLVGQFRGALRFEFAVVTGVLRYLSLLEVNNLVDH